MTKLSLSELYENWSKSDSIEKAIDSLTGGLGDEFYLPNSTAYSYMSLLLIACRLNFEFLNISLPHELGLSTLRNLDQKKLASIFNNSALIWHPRSQAIIQPP